MNLLPAKVYCSIALGICPEDGSRSDFSDIDVEGMEREDECELLVAKLSYSGVRIYDRQSPPSVVVHHRSLPRTTK